MAEGKPFLPETETAVPLICQPSESMVVGVLGGRMTFKVLSEQTGGVYAIVEQCGGRVAVHTVATTGSVVS